MMARVFFFFPNFFLPVFGQATVFRNTFRCSEPHCLRCSENLQRKMQKKLRFGLKTRKKEENTSEHPLLQRKRRKKKMKTKQKWAKGKGIWWNTDTPRSGTPMLAVGTPSSIGTPVVRTIKKFALKTIKKKS